MLRTAMGPEILKALMNKNTLEVMLNPDGKLWLDLQGQGRVDTGETLPAPEAERLIRLVASHMGCECHAKNPIISAELPETGERFEGLLPPVVLNPVFSIRKKAEVIFDLQDYVEQEIITPLQKQHLVEAVRSRKNILVVGGTSSGKTTLTNALLQEVAKANDRVVLIEDTRELQCAAKDCVALRTKDGIVDLPRLVRSTLRLRPDRIIIGEVRGPEALDMLKAWNTGHPGGIT
ncbi:MAG: P-type conjugative transfer ATPase TrbB, partial [Opitutaceae bacterium]|nr:P-type conjugative transfer ATPase TrbB [Opitutaceae bacterium]